MCTHGLDHVDSTVEKCLDFLVNSHCRYTHASCIIILCPELRAELQLDWLKGTRGGAKRVLFIDTQQPQRTGLLTLGHNRPRACLTYTIYLKVSQSHTFMHIF